MEGANWAATFGTLSAVILQLLKDWLPIPDSAKKYVLAALTGLGGVLAAFIGADVSGVDIATNFGVAAGIGAATHTLFLQGNRLGAVLKDIGNTVMGHALQSPKPK